MSKKTMNKQQMTERHNTMAIQAIKYEGIIPPPNMLAQYDQIQKWFADRIITMAEKQQQHRFKLEEKGVDEMFRRDKRWQYIAWWILLVFVVWAIVLLGLWRTTEWYALIWTTAFWYLWSWFFWRKNNNENKEKENK